MKNELVAPNFIPPVTTGDFVFGSGELKGTILRENGDWRDYLVPDEQQSRGAIETSACATFHTIRPIAILQEEVYSLLNENYSERFISQLSGTTKVGNSPNKVAQAIRDFGLIADSLLPFSEDITSWEEYNSFKGGNKDKCLVEGQKWRTAWNFGYDWVFQGNPSIEVKYQRMKEALKYSPLGISVYAWVRNDNGEYYRPAGAPDTHWCTAVYIDEKNRIYVHDTYEPFIKILEPNYDIGFCMRYSIEKKQIPTQGKSFWGKVLEYILRVIASLHAKNN